MSDDPPGNRPSRYGFGKVLIPAREEVTKPENPVARRKLGDMGKPGGPPLQVPVHTARREQTQRGLAPPTRGAPQTAALDTLKGMGPVPALPELEPPSDRSPYTRKLSPAPWDPLRSSPELREAVERRGGRLVQAPESTPMPALDAALTPSLVARAEKFPLAKWLVLIGSILGGLTALVSAIGTQVTSIMAASRPTSIAELEKKLEALEARVGGGNGVVLEAQAREKKDSELQKELDAVKKELGRLAPMQVKGDPAAAQPAK